MSVRVAGAARVDGGRLSHFRVRFPVRFRDFELVHSATGQVERVHVDVPGQRTYRLSLSPSMDETTTSLASMLNMTNPAPPSTISTLFPSPPALASFSSENAATAAVMRTCATRLEYELPSYGPLKHRERTQKSAQTKSPSKGIPRSSTNDIHSRRCSSTASISGGYCNCANSSSSQKRGH